MKKLQLFWMAPMLAKGIRNHLFWFSFNWLPCSDRSEDSLPGTYGTREKDPTVLLVDNSGSGSTQAIPSDPSSYSRTLSFARPASPLRGPIAPQVAAMNLDPQLLHLAPTVTQAEPTSETSKA